MKYLPILLLIIFIAVPVFGQDKIYSEFPIIPTFILDCKEIPPNAESFDIPCKDIQDIKKALELALWYLDPPNPIINILKGPFYPINTPPETEIEKLRRLAKESKIKAENFEKKAKDIEFIKKVYDENF